jgi:hypothetical protein
LVTQAGYASSSPRYGASDNADYSRGGQHTSEAQLRAIDVLARRIGIATVH